MRNLRLIVFTIYAIALPSVQSMADAAAQTEPPVPPQAAAAEQPALLPATLVERLCESYSGIESVSCEIRKTTKSGIRTMRMLSRVHYKKPNRIHVDNVSPAKRTIIADGKRLYYHEAGVARGFSRPISELSETWLKPLHNIPGTPLEHLLPLRGLPAIELPASVDGKIREAYEKDGVYVVLTADDQNRLHQVDFFKSSEMASKTGEYTFAHLQEVEPDCWIPLQHKATLFLPEGEVAVETRRVSNLSVNGSIPDHLFNHELFFRGVEFVDDFQKTYR